MIVKSETQPTHPPAAHNPAPPTSPPTPQQPSAVTHDGIDLHDLPQLKLGGIALIALAVVLVFAGLFLIGYLPHRERQAALIAEAAQSAERLPVANVAKPMREANVTEILLPGNVRPKQETAIFSRTNGYLKKLYVDIGERVKEGQLLAEIDTPEIDAQLGRSHAALEQAKADAQKSESDSDLAQNTFERYQAFAKDGGVTKQQLDEKRFALQQSKAAVASAKASISAAQAEVDRLTKLQGFQKITSPFDGIVTSRPMDIGTLLSADNTDPGKDLFHITRTNPLRVFVDVPQVYISMIQNNSPASLEVRNFPGRQFKGQVMRSTGEVDSSTRTLKFLVMVPNDDGALYPGMYAQVRFQITDETPPLTVPSSALVFTNESPSVAVVIDDTIHFKKVSLGRDFGSRVQVLQGLTTDDSVVTNPGERMIEGTRVQVAAIAEKTSPKP